MRPFLCVWILALFAFSPGRAASLSLHQDRSDPLDIAISGELEGLAPGQIGYLWAKELRTLPGKTLVSDNRYFKGKNRLTVIPLEELWAALPRRSGTDTLLASCADGYASVYGKDFLEKYRPFLVIAINGLPLDKVTENGAVFDGGPYIIDVSESLAPGVSVFLDIGHKEPWGVTSLAVVAHSVYFASLYPAKTTPSSDPAVDQGRSIWINSCNSCHQGPDQHIGGNKSGIPFAVVQAQALYNQSYFRQYVRDPQKIASGSKMEPHPHYTDAHFDALTAFLRSIKL